MSGYLPALVPYLILAGGIVALLVLVAWLRSEAVAFGGTLVILVAALASAPWALEQGPRSVDGLLRVDGFAMFFLALFSLAAIVTAVLCRRYLEPRAAHRQEFYLLLLIATLGAAVTASAAHFAGFLLGMEVLSISLYAMIAYPQQGRAPLEAAIKYLVLSGAASSTMLFGMALIYLVTGSLAFDFGTIMPGTGGELRLLSLGQAMLLAGVFFKLSLVPFHMWTPDVYQGAPAPVTGFVATVSKGAVFAVLLRYAVDVELLSGHGAMHTAMVLVAILSMIGGNLLALLQTNLKRLLAYSSIAHLGYLMIAVVVAGTPAGRALGIETALVYLAGYFLMSLAAFGVMTVLSSDTEDAESLSAYHGLFWKRPLLAAVLAAAALSLAGIPLTVGFIAKFYLVTAGVEGAAWALVWALVIGSAIGVYYYLRIVFAMTGRDAQHDTAQPPRRLPWESVLTVAMLGLWVVILGIYPGPAIDLVQGLTGP